MKKPSAFFIKGLLIAAIILISDQISKHLLLGLFVDNPFRVIEVTSFFNLVMVWNHGVSFGMFAEHRQPLLLIAVALIIVTYLLFWLWKATHRWVVFGIGMVIGGAIGNVIDRVRFGAVADFFDFHAMGMHWPAFNIADSAIFIGVVVLCIDSMFLEESRRKRIEKEEGSSS